MRILSLICILIGLVLCQKESLQWYPLKNEKFLGTSEIPLSGSTRANPTGFARSSLIEAGGRLFIFGGVRECATYIQSNDTCLNQYPEVLYIYYYDLELQAWFKKRISGPTPAPRTLQNAVSYGGTIYMYGGAFYNNYQSPFIIFDDFWRHSSGGNTWTALSKSPGPRFGHGMVSIDDGYIYLGFGGSRINETVESNLKNDLWMYNILLNTWTLLVPNDPFNTSIPAVRYDCNMEYNRDHHAIILHGGRNVITETNITVDQIPVRSVFDTWIYYIDTNEWKVLIPDGPSFEPVFSSISGTFGNIFYIAAGETLDQNSCINVNNSVLLPAGMKHKAVNNLYAYEFGERGSIFRELKPESNIIPTVMAASTAVGKKIYAWGGFNLVCPNGQSLINYPTSIWEFQMNPNQPN